MRHADRQGGWTGSGNWRRPPGSPRRFAKTDEVARKGDGTLWRLLREAKALVAGSDADLDGLEQVLVLVLDAREVDGERTTRANPLPCGRGRTRAPARAG